MATRAARGTAVAPTGRQLTDTDLCVCIINIYAFRLPFSFCLQGGGATKTGADVRSFMAFSA